MTTDKKTDQEVVQSALKHIVDDELPKYVMLTATQHKKLIELIEFATMVSSVKKFGVPAFNLAITIAGVYIALKQFFVGKP